MAAFMPSASTPRRRSLDRCWPSVSRRRRRPRSFSARRGAGLAWMLGSTRTGKLLVAVIHDTEVSRAMGINVDRMYLYTFTFGSLLAAIGGAFTAPTVSVVPALGVEVIVLSFAVVVIGGLGSLPGAALGAVMVGLVRSAAIHYLPQAELFVIYLVMAMVLAFRPRGLFSIAEARKI